VNRIFAKSPLAAVMILGCAGVLTVALLRPYYFSDPRLLGSLIFLQLTAAILWRYQQRFFLFLILIFLWAGTPLPMHDVWTVGRWFVLGVGAATGVVLWTRIPHRPFAGLHLAAAGCVLAALASALVSAYPEVAFLKAASLFLLFLFGAAGARLAIAGREGKFFSGLLLGCELLVYGTALLYFVAHIEAFGNRNSLGVAMGVVAFPILLWGLMISAQPGVRRRRMFALLLCLLLLFASYERAGIVAALVSFTIVCISLRRYRLLIEGLAVALAIAVLASAIAPPRNASVSDDGSLTSRFVYKGKREDGVFASRRTVWDQTLSSLEVHPWFGTGFGTSSTFDEKTEISDKFSSADQVNREHGNSYLEIAEWVGLLGVTPFLLLLGLIVTHVCRVLWWMRQTGSPFSYAVPLAIFLIGGLAHAGFEDWLFAVGYHTCVLFWSFAFVLPDLLPNRVNRQFAPVKFHPAIINNSFRAATAQ